MEDTLRQRLEDIASDRVSGAREIVGRLWSLLDDHSGRAGRGLSCEELVEVAALVVPAQPSMAPLLSGFDRLFAACEESGASGVAAGLRGLVAEHRSSVDALAHHGVRALEGRSILATLSWSSTVAAVLEGLDRRVELMVAESRPGLEGRRAAARAAGQGHRVTLHTDSAFPAAAARAQVLLLGGDALLPRGLVNKVGSRPAARECRAAGVPVCALMDPSKVLGGGLAQRLRVLPESPGEVWDSPPPRVQVVNPYFELVPLELVDQVWGPEGALTPDDTLARAASSSPARLWKQVPPPREGLTL